MEYGAQNYSYASSTGSQGSDYSAQLIYLAEKSDSKSNCCTVISPQDISERQRDAIDSVSSLCSLSPSDSKILLHHFKWKVSILLDEWFTDEQKLRKDLGLFDKAKASVKELRAEEEQLYCSICMETHSVSEMKAPGCAHYFCKQCWTKYIEISIREDGMGCLSLKCPEPKCGAAVGEDIVLCLITDEQDRTKYERFLVESYVGQNERVKWCPFPECEYAVELQSGITESYDVTCKCCYNFCWSCSEEMHRPVDCDTARKWVLKNRDNAETENWKIVNTKPCPRCGRAIEKNEGCMHMTCVEPCKFHFCWSCLGDWQGHPDFYACNRFEVEEQGTQNEKSESEEEKIAMEQREAIKQSLDRYSHYYERWAAHEKSRAKAELNVKHAEDFPMKQLADIQFLPRSHVQLVRDAWAQIVECARVLKWTYVYGYYLAENENKKKSAHKELFEHTQASAESHLEQLQQCVERELQVFIESEKPAEEFNEFRIRLDTLTDVTGSYFQNLVTAIENEAKEELNTF